MTTEQLTQAKELHRKITACNNALDCFEWDLGKLGKRSTNPSIIIEYDGPDGREKVRLPFEINEPFFVILQAAIRDHKEMYEKEFKAL